MLPQPPTHSSCDAPALLKLAETDNVYIAARALSPGPYRLSSGELIDVVEPVPLGYKIAACHLAAGDPIVRYGMPIGSATRSIEPGSLVHVHNLASEYIHTFSHRGGQR
jgi:hypothetical protein